jgi:hypothetical protein
MQEPPPPGTIPRVSASSPHPHQVVIEFEPDASPVAGVIREPGWRPRRFTGWLELLAALEAATTQQDEPNAP